MAIKGECKVLLVDDDTAFRESTSQLVRAKGYACDSVADVETARRLLKSNTWDVVVSDLCMDGNLRLEFVRDLCRSQCRPSIILVTAYPGFDTAIEALDLGLCAYLVKPFAIEQLTARIEQTFSYKQPCMPLKTSRNHLNETREALDVVNHFLASLSHESKVERGRNEAEPRECTAAISHEFVAERLTPRERELVGYLEDGYRVSTIARRLYISPHTVRRHLKSIFLKLEVKSQAELLEKLKPWKHTY